MPEPDYDGFAAAQHAHRQRFGEEVWFLQEASVTLPPGTPTDPETSKALDPVLQQSAEAASGVVASASAAVNVAFNARQEDVEQDALGMAERTHVMLICDEEVQPLASAAVSFLLREDRYKITSQKPDSFGPVGRWLIYGRRQ